MDRLVTYKNRQLPLKDVLFIILFEWHLVSKDKDVLIQMIIDKTGIEEIIAVDFVVELRPPDIIAWTETEYGKKYMAYLEEKKLKSKTVNKE